MKKPDETCFNCHELLHSCKCGKTETYETDEGVRCPYCCHLNTVADSDGALYDESLDKYDCDSCGKTFGVSASVTWAWSATKTEHWKM